MVVSSAEGAPPSATQGPGLERLAADERRTLAYASAIGHEFDFPLLVAATGRGDEALAEQLERLAHLGILREASGGDRFGFVVESSRTGIYQSLTASRLRVIHRKIAEAMERLYPDAPPEIVAELGRHFFLGRVPEKSYLYNRRAAELARADDLPEVAAHHLERARIDLPTLVGRSPGEAAELDAELGDLYCRSGDFPGAERMYSEALVEAGPESGELRGRVLLSQAELARDRARSEDAVRHALAARELFQRTPNRAGDGSVHRILGRVAYERGAFREALDEALRAREIFEELGRRDLLGRTYVDLGNAYRALGPATRPDALASYERALSILTESSDWPEVARAYLNRALLVGWDSPARALDDLVKGREYAERAHEPRWTAWALVSGIEFRLMLGQVDEAERDNQLASGLFERADEPRGIQQVRLNAGILAERRARWEDAEAAYQEAVDHARLLHLPAEEAEALFHLAGLWVKTRDYGRAREAYRHAARLDLPRLCPWLSRPFGALGRELAHDPPSGATSEPTGSTTRP